MFFNQRRVRGGARKSLTAKLDYTRLEARELLAVAGFRDGHLAITLFNEGDRVVVDTVGDLVTINENPMIGGQKVAAADVRTLSVKGVASRLDQHVVFRGHFTLNNSNLENLYAAHVTSVTFAGNYDVSNQLAIVLSGSEPGGQITDSLGGMRPGRIQVGGWSWLNAGSHPISLKNMNHRFDGPVHLFSSNVDNGVVLNGSGDITLNTSMVQGNLQMATGGQINNGVDASIEIGARGIFEAGSVILGTTATDTFRAGSLTFNTQGLFRVTQNNDVHITGNSTAGTAWINSLGKVATTTDASFSTTAFAAFYGAAGIELGTQENSSISFGSLTVNSPQHVRVSHEGPLLFGGNSQVASLTVTSQGLVNNSTTARLNISGDLFVTAPAISLGRQLGSEFNSGRVRFQSTGPVELSQQSSLTFFGKNSSMNLLATSLGAVTTDPATILLTEGFAAFFGSAGIDLGRSENTTIQVGGLTLNSPQQAYVNIAGDVMFVGDGSVANLVLTATGHIGNGSQTRVNVTQNASLQGISINLGNQFSDTVTFGRVNFSASENVMIHQDNRMVLFGDNVAQNATLRSAGNILDAAMTHTVIHGLLDVEGNIINLGTAADESLSVQRLRFNSADNTNIKTISSVQFTGDSFAGNRLIFNAAGDITDLAPSHVRVANRVDLTAENIILGGALDRCFEIFGEDPLSRLVLNTPAGGIQNVVLSDC